MDRRVAYHDVFVCYLWIWTGWTSHRKSDAVHRKAQDIIVIERDFVRVESARAYNFTTIFGDASELRTLRIAQVGIAHDVVVCVGGPGGSTVVKAARRVAPAARIRAALPTPDFRDALIAAGADDVIVVSDLAGVLLARSLHS